MRITQTTMSSNALYNLQGGLNRMQELQNKLSTGLEVTKPSDSPERFLTGQQSRSSLARTETFIRNADNAQAWLKITDSALQDAVTRLHRVEQLTLQGANSTHDENGLRALANEIRSMREGFKEITETEYAGRKIFAGTADVHGGVYADQAVGAAPKYAFNGNSEPILRAVGPDVTLNIAPNTRKAFGEGNDSLFATLDQIADDIENGRIDAVRGGLDKIKGHRSGMLDALSESGTILNRVEGLRARAIDQKAALKNHKSEAESADLAETAVQVMTQKVAYEAALAATSRVIQPSLMDFLR